MCLISLVEMAGRFSAVSRHTIADAIRERFGFPFFLVPLMALTLVTLLVLASEIGGVCLALKLLTGVAVPWWALPVASPSGCCSDAAPSASSSRACRCWGW